MKTYCTQNHGDCEICSLKNYHKDCRNNPVAITSIGDEEHGAYCQCGRSAWTCPVHGANYQASMTAQANHYDADIARSALDSGEGFFGPLTDEDRAKLQAAIDADDVEA